MAGAVLLGMMLAQGFGTWATEIEADEEVVVKAPPLETDAEAVANRMLDTYLSRERGRRLYLQHRYAEAVPYLLAAAKRGFKMSQARLGEIYVLGLDDVPQDIAAGMGWLGVAASGTTMPSIRNRFKELRSHVPPPLQPRLETIVAAFAAKYGSEATGVTCTRDKLLGTNTTKLDCFFGDEWKYVRYFGVDADESLDSMGLVGTRFVRGR
ncbi:MAG: sel1 repeat family protein [Gammaproteobacteria bacterium]|nr:sel1 repeat family protein [Gammaproteobacteria bacterium]